MSRLADEIVAPAKIRRILRTAALCAASAGAASVLLLALSGWFLTAAATAAATGYAAAFNYLLPSAAIRGLAIARTAARYGERLLSHQAALLAMAELRGRLFGKLAAQDSRAAPDLSSGAASARLIGDIAALENLVVRRPGRTGALVGAGLGVGVASLAGWKAALCLGLVLAVTPFALAALARRLTRGPSAAAASALGDLRSRFVDYATARPEIVAYGAGARVSAELLGICARLGDAKAALARSEGVMLGLTAFNAVAAASIVLLVGDGPAANIALAALGAAASVEGMGAPVLAAFRQAGVDEALSRLNEMSSLVGAPKPASPPPAPATITIGRETFAPGARIAILGPSGSGKTRLIEALAGLKPPVHELAAGGAPLTSWDASDLSGQIALAPQDAALIAGTVADNLRLARPGVTEEDMRAALAVTCLDQWAAGLPHGLETSLDEGGGLLSGGERKRLALARALLADRPWLALDEPTEGLDAMTEAALVRRLSDWLDATGRGLILASHRPAPLRLARRSIHVGHAGADRAIWTDDVRVAV